MNRSWWPAGFRMPGPGRPGYFLVVLMIGVLQVSAVCRPADPGGDGGISSRAQSVFRLGFGSEAVLTGLWTSEELKGASEDQQAVRVTTRIQPPAPALDGIHTPLKTEFRGSIRHVRPAGQKKIVALTFDLCETANKRSGYDAEIVNYLRNNRVKATFFAGGKWMQTHPEKTLQLMADPLFEIGNHSWSHPNFRLIDTGRMENQILWTQSQYERLWLVLREKALEKHIDPAEMDRIPQWPRLFRFPYGTCNSEALELLGRLGLSAIQWDIVTGDPSKARTSAMIAKGVLREIHPGAVIVCHANGRGYGTAGALPLFVPELRAGGYEFVTVSELLAQGAAVTSSRCYERVPGDNLLYDHVAEKPKGNP